MSIAVLMACFNRKDITRKCLSLLFSQQLPEGFELKVFVCDDRSTDGTGEMIELEFPQVEVVQGNGKLYWGGGMRKAWELAKNHGNFDFFLWLNDDTLLYPDGLKQVWEDYLRVEPNSIIVGTCAQPGTRDFTYGGHGMPYPIYPNGMPQKLTFMNGNVVLIPKIIEEKIGGISPAYTQNLGDYDYSLRAQAAGFLCYTSSDFVAECAQNTRPHWSDNDLPFMERWRLVWDIKGLAFDEYIFYKKYHYGSWVAFKSKIDVLLKVLSPKKYVRLRNLIRSKS